MEPSFDARALSQSEIDALLAKLASDTDQAESGNEQQWKVVKAYDFRRPDKLSKDQMRTLQLLHESFGRVAGSSLSAFLRNAVQLSLSTIEQSVYGEFVDQVPSDTILFILTLEPLPGNILIGLDLTSAMMGVDRLLGGPGLVPKSIEAPTDIELALIQTLVSHMVAALKEAWGRVMDLDPVIRDVVMDARFVQVALKSDPVVVVAFELGLQRHSGSVTLCVPYVVLEPALPNLNAQSWFAASRRGKGGQSEFIRRSLDAVSVPLSVELGGAWVTLQDLEQLKEGDVLVLDRSVDRAFDLLVGDKRKFAVRPGMVGNKLAVQVVDRKSDTEE